MGLWSALLYIGLVLTAEPTTGPTTGPAASWNFSELPPVTQWKISQELMRDYVLKGAPPAGRSFTTAGLSQIQNSRLQQWQQSFILHSESTPSATWADQSFDLSDDMRDLAEYFRYSSDGSENLGRWVETFRKSSPDLNIDDFLLKLRYEQSLALQRLRYLDYGAAAPFFGLSLDADDVKTFSRLFKLSWWDMLTPDLQKAILDQRELSMDQLVSYLSALEDQSLDRDSFAIHEAYQKYLVFVRILSHPERFTTQDIFVQALQEIQMQSGVIDSDASDRSGFERELLWRWVEHTRQQGLWTPAFTRAWTASAGTNFEDNLGWAWVRVRFSDVSTVKRFFDARKLDEADSAFQDPRGEFKITIDDIVEDKYAESKFEFDSAELQIATGKWATLAPDEFAYTYLSADLRRLLLAKLFPDLHLNYAQALIEQKISELSVSNQFALASEISESGQAHQLLQGISIEKRIYKPQELARISRGLVEIYLRDRRPASSGPLVDPEDETSSLLRQGDRPAEKLLTTRAEELRLDHYLDRLKPEARPGILAEFIARNFYPSPDHWSNFDKRLGDSLRRRRIEQNWQPKWEALYQRSLAAKNPQDRLAIEIENKELLKDFFVNAMQGTQEDSSSLAPYVSSYLWGAEPHGAKDLPRVGKSIGLAVAFSLASALTDPKFVLLFVLSDTGLKFVSAGYGTPGSAVDLQQGFSTPIGSMTAEMLDGLYLNATTLMSDKASFADQMGASKDLGRFSFDTAIFTAAGWGTSRSLHDVSSLEKLRTYRKLEWLKEQSAAVAARKEKFLSEIADRTPLIADRLAEREALDPFAVRDPKLLLNLDREVLEPRQELDRLQNGVVGYDAKLVYIAKQILVAAARLAEFVVYPLTFVRTEARGELDTASSGERIFQRFRQSAHYGVSQLEHMQSKFRGQAQDLYLDGMRSEARPQEKTASRKLDAAVDEYKSQQDQTSVAVRRFYVRRMKRLLREPQSPKIAGDFLAEVQHLQSIAKGLGESLTPVQDILRIQGLEKAPSPRSDTTLNVLGKVEQVRTAGLNIGRFIKNWTWRRFSQEPSLPYRSFELAEIQNRPQFFTDRAVVSTYIEAFRQVKSLRDLWENWKTDLLTARRNGMSDDQVSDVITKANKVETDIAKLQNQLDALQPIFENYWKFAKSTATDLNPPSAR